MPRNGVSVHVMFVVVSPKLESTVPTLMCHGNLARNAFLEIKSCTPTLKLKWLLPLG